MANFNNPKFCKSILDLAQAYGPYTFWTDNLLNPERNPDAIWRALMVVAALKDPLYVGYIRKLLLHSDSRVRAWACTALAELKDLDGFTHIQPLTQDPSSRVHYHANKAMRSFQTLAQEMHRHHKRTSVAKTVILASEDDESILKYYNFGLSRMGYLVQIASNEQDTVEIAIKLRPHVIITDNAKDNDSLSGLNMTWDLCRRKELRDTLFFMVTVDIVEPIFLWSGGDEYFEKPTDIDRLDKMIKAYLITS